MPWQDAPTESTSTRTSSGIATGPVGLVHDVDVLGCDALAQLAGEEGLVERHALAVDGGDEVTEKAQPDPVVEDDGSVLALDGARAGLVV